MTFTDSPPWRVSRGRTSTRRGICTPPPTTIATPIGSRWISSAMAAVKPSTLAVIAFRSFGFVTFRINCVLHWLSTFLSTLAARCVTITSPSPNWRPSDAIVRKIFEEFTAPTCGQKLCASSTTSIIGGIRFTFRSSNSAVQIRFTIRSLISLRVPLQHSDDVRDAVVLRRRAEQVERLPQLREVCPHLSAGGRKAQDVPGVQVRQREPQRLRARVHLRLRGELDYLPVVRVRPDPEPFHGVRLLPSLRERRVLPVGVEDDRRDAVFHELFHEDADRVRLPAAGLRDHGDVLLHHAVDVEEDRDVVAAEHPHVRPVLLVVLQPDDLSD